MRIVVRHDESGHWWWTLHAEDGRTLAISTDHGSRSDVLRSIAELKVEGPSARVDVEDAGPPAPLTPPAAARARSRA